ncbi:MAG TPA: L,D-transpeptidase family protein [Alphaproteobacteria bacterium]|nr:L,D-transpeptidase family protein [Alphaproteobacteria bacterium]
MVSGKWMRPAFLPVAIAFLLAVGACLAARSAYAQPQAAGDDLIGRLRIVSLNNQKLSDVARANDVSTPNAAAANWGLSEFFPETRGRVLLPRAHILPDGLRDGILINRSEFRLYYIQGGMVLFTAPIGIGDIGLETPVGTTKVVRKMQNPSWIPTAEARAAHPELPKVWPPGPDNPMGLYALYLGWRYYAIHGNEDAFGIGRQSTRGCIRLFPEDIEPLFGMVPIGTGVQVIDQPVKLGWHEGELFIEAQPDEAQREELAVQGSFTLKPPSDLKDWISGVAGNRAHEVNWELVADVLARRSGIPTQLTGLAAHPVNIFEPNMLLSEGLSKFLKTQRGFAAKPAAKPGERRPSYEEIIKEHRLKFPYNI